jgi:hypothetical protein
MGFSGMRAIIMDLILVALWVAVSQLDLLGWIVPVGLIAAGVAMKAWGMRARSRSKLTRSKLTYLAPRGEAVTAGPDYSVVTAVEVIPAR